MKQQTQTLEWGETPWDKKTKPELLREIQRMFAALRAAKVCLSIMEGNDPFWGVRGTGGRAVQRVAAVCDSVEAEADPEDIYRAFFRYADGLLFPSVPGSQKWFVCGCGSMWENGGTTIEKCPCGGALRPIEWSDLKPANPQEK